MVLLGPPDAACGDVKYRLLEANYWKLEDPAEDLPMEDENFSLASRNFERIFYSRIEELISPCLYTAEKGYVPFSVSSSQMGIDIMVGSITVHLPKHSSVHHPVVQMVLFAIMSINGLLLPSFHGVPKPILDITEQFSPDSCGTDVPTVYEALWVPAKIHSPNAPNGSAISDACRTVRKDWLSLPVLFDVSMKGEKMEFKIPESNKLPGDCCSKYANGQEALICDTESPCLSVGGRTMLNSSEEWHGSQAYVLATPQSLTSGEGSSTSTSPLLLWLDSGASHHAVGDARILCNFQDPPAGAAVRVADGFRLLVTKVGEIQTENFRIPDVYLVPGLQMNVISVRQLARSKIIPTFYENHAELWREGERVGGAIADDETSLYRLYYLTGTGNNAAALTS